MNTYLLEFWYQGDYEEPLSLVVEDRVGLAVEVFVEALSRAYRYIDSPERAVSVVLQHFLEGIGAEDVRMYTRSLRNQIPFQDLPLLWVDFLGRRASVAGQLRSIENLVRDIL